MSNLSVSSQARTRDFKIGQIHGKPSTSESSSEVVFQRNLFSSQVVHVIRSRDKAKNSLMRLFAYELPLGFYRDWCVDLAGYDQNRDLYLIELKRGSSSEDINDVIDQVNRYAEIVSRLDVKEGIEDEFRRMYHLPPDYKFKSIKKVILSEKIFFQNQRYALEKCADGIEFLFIETDCVLKSPAQGVRLRVWKKK
jgi:hypothetical protein